MSYELKEIVHMMQVYHVLESETKDFLFISASAMKNKEYQIKKAESLLKAIDEYKKLPQEVKKELENNKSTSASKIIELEKISRDIIKAR